MSDSFTLRPYQPSQDFPALERLIHAVDHTDPQLQAWSYSLLEAKEFPHHALEQDRFVLMDRSEALGYGWIGGPQLERPDLWLCVHPEHRRKGYGSALLERLLKRARERGAGEAAGYIKEHRPEYAHFAAQRGFGRVGFYRELLRAAHLPLEPAVFPKGWTVRTYAQLPNPQTVVEAYQRSFGDLWGHNPTTLENLTPWLEEIDPNGLFMLFDGLGNVAGNVVATRSLRLPSGPSGNEPHLLDAPGLAPEHRRPELYAALANLALEWLLALEKRDVVLESWGDADAVMSAYGALGFVESSRSSYVWQRLALEGVEG